MGTIAERLAVVALAAAQSIRLGLVYLKLHWREVGAFVAAVAQWLLRAFATATPIIIFARFQIRHVGEFLGDNGF